MSAHLIQKCPQCDAVTSDCIDYGATEDRTEYQSVRCKSCINAERRPKNHGMGLGNGRLKCTKTKALMTHKFTGTHY
jgi:phage FluMu protein Com